MKKTKIALLTLMIVNFLVNSNYSQAPALPNLPITCGFNISVPADTACYVKKTVCPQGGNVANYDYPDLQSALNAISYKTILLLDANGIYDPGLNTSFSLPNKTGDGWIIITGKKYNLLGTDTTRLIPTAGTTDQNYPTKKSSMPKLQSLSTWKSTLATALNAHHYMFIGVEISNMRNATNNTLLPSNATTLSNLVELGNGGSAQNALTKVANHLIFDRCYIHGNPNISLSRCIALNSAFTAIKNSWIDEAHGLGTDAQAICGWNGPGPFKIVNNHLEGSTENILFGGADTYINKMTPSDIEIIGNHIMKPYRWRSKNMTLPIWQNYFSSTLLSPNDTTWVIKNLIEIKHGRRILIRGNLIENTWVNAQTGYAILLTPRNQSGTNPWVVSSDVTIEKNVIRSASGGFELLGSDYNNVNDSVSTRLLIKNNLIYDIHCTKYGNSPSTSNHFMVNSGSTVTSTYYHDITWEHNTCSSTTTSFIYFNGCLGIKMKITDNIFENGVYGVTGISSPAPYNAMLNMSTITDANYLFHNNVIYNDSVASPNNNCVGTTGYSMFISSPMSKSYYHSAATANSIGFSSVTAQSISPSDYHAFVLKNSSIYKNAGTDGKDIGCDIISIDSVINSSSALELKLVSPLNNANLSGVSANLNWADVNCNKTYVYEYSTSSCFLSNVITGTTNLNQVQINTLSSNTIYYWRLRSYNSLDTSCFVGQWNFKTGISTGIVELKKENGVQVFPNPTADIINVIIPQVKSGVLIKLIDIRGVCVKEKLMNEGSEDLKMEVSDLSAGTYILRCYFDTEIVNKKLIIAK